MEKKREMKERKKGRIWISEIEGTLRSARSVGRKKNINRRGTEDRVLSRHRNTEKEKKRRIKRRKRGKEQWNRDYG